MAGFLIVQTGDHLLRHVLPDPSDVRTEGVRATLGGAEVGAGHSFVVTLGGPHGNTCLKAGKRTDRLPRHDDII